MNNIFDNLPDNLENEIFEDLQKSNNLKIERIISYGHFTPENEWYDQDKSEWVMIISGYGEILFENGTIKKMKAGDYILIPAHQKHKVIKTAKNEHTIWLAIHF